MSEWWTYRLTSFLLFSPRTYYRTIELYNLAIWPAHLAGLAIGLAVVALLATHSGWRNQIVAALLAVCWLWIGWAFLYERYAQINWVATWIGALFALQSGLFVGVGVIGRRLAFEVADRRASRLAIALITFIVVGYPLLAPLGGRMWTSAEVFGVAADPTALATVGAVALVRGRIRWLLLVVPLLWCGFTALTLRAMKSPETFVVTSVTLLALLPAVVGRRNGTAARAPTARPAR
jgi:hypothetical protein